MRSFLARQALDWAIRILLLLTTQLLGRHSAAWAQAMIAEVRAIGEGNEALAFAWGCFCTAFKHALLKLPKRVFKLQNAGLLSCIGCVLSGCAFMFAAGAPKHYMGMNFVSLLVGILGFCYLPVQRLQTDDLLRGRMIVTMSLMLLVVSGLGGNDRAMPWIELGPVHLNVVWVIVPPILIASNVQSHSKAVPWSLAGLAITCVALVLLGEVAWVSLLAAVLLIRAKTQRSYSLGILAFIAVALALYFRRAWSSPEPAVFVDQVLQSALSYNLLVGLLLALTQVASIVPGFIKKHSREHAQLWGGVVLLSVFGWVPSPLIGFGGSLIVGYLLSLALAPRDARQAPNDLQSFDSGARACSSVAG